MLVARVASEDDVVGVDVVLGGGSDAAGIRHADSEAANDDNAGYPQNARAGELGGEQIGGPEGDAGVDETKKHGRADEAETRHEENGKEQGSAERAEIIKSEDVRDHVAEFIAIPDDAHEQRDFQADENAHNNDERVEN